MRPIVTFDPKQQYEVREIRQGLARQSNNV